MKKILSIGLVLIIVNGFTLVSFKNASAMNNESAAMLAGAIAIFGKPVLNAIGNEIFFPPYNSRTTPIYEYDPCYRPRTAYEKGWCAEQLRIQREQERLEYQRGREDARRYFYGY